MKLEDLNIIEKASILEELIQKSEEEADYTITVDWKDNPSSCKKDAKIIIDNVHTIFSGGGIDTFDSDVKASVYANFNVQLDSYLKMFPEYKENDITTERTIKHM